MPLPMNPVWDLLAEWRFYHPIRGLRLGGRNPTADAVGYELQPLRGWHLRSAGGALDRSPRHEPWERRGVNRQPRMGRKRR